MNYDIGVFTRRRIISPAESYYAVPPVEAAGYTGPGNVVGSAVAWWGLRAYTLASIGGNAIRLRASGDSAEANFVTLADGSLDVASISAFQSTHGGSLFVNTLYDQTGNGNNFVKVTGTDQPSLVLSVLSGKPIVRLAAASLQSMGRSGGGIAQAQPLTMSMVYNRTATGGGDTYILGDNNCCVGGRSGANTLDLYAGTDTSTTMSDNAFHAVQAVFNGSSSDANIDGSANTVNPGTNGTGSGFLAIAAIFGAFWQGDFAELGLWGSAFSGAQSTSMSTNQHSYWGF